MVDLGGAYLPSEPANSWHRRAYGATDTTAFSPQCPHHRLFVCRRRQFKKIYWRERLQDRNNANFALFMLVWSPLVTVLFKIKIVTKTFRCLQI